MIRVFILIFLFWGHTCKGQIPSLGGIFSPRIPATEIVLPTVETYIIANITETSASGGGNVTSNGGGSVTQRGICWSTAINPDINNSRTINGTGLGGYNSYMDGLNANTTYYVRAYATNQAGTNYGEQVSFTTASDATIPVVTTIEPYGIDYTTVYVGGNIITEGGSSIIAKGIVYNTTGTPTLAHSSKLGGLGVGSYEVQLTNLTPGTTYFIRAYATNSVGTAYGNEVTVTTESVTVPTVITCNLPLDITPTTVTLCGEGTDDGGLEIIGYSIELGWHPDTLPQSLNATGSFEYFTATFDYLSPNTTYYYRAFAINSEGSYLGDAYSFTTLPDAGTISYEGNEYTVTEQNGCNVFTAAGSVQYLRNIWTDYVSSAAYDSLEITSFNPNYDGDSYSTFKWRNYNTGVDITSFPFRIAVKDLSYNSSYLPDLAIHFTNYVNGVYVLCEAPNQSCSYTFRIKNTEGVWGTSKTVIFNRTVVGAPTYDSGAYALDATQYCPMSNGYTLGMFPISVGLLTDNYLGHTPDSIQIISINGDYDNDGYSGYTIVKENWGGTVATLPITTGVLNGIDYHSRNPWIGLEYTVSSSSDVCGKSLENGDKALITYRIKGGGMWGDLRTFTATISTN